MEMGKRQRCSRCAKRRKITTVWEDTDKGLCRECSLTDGVAFMYSVRKTSIGWNAMGR